MFRVHFQRSAAEGVGSSGRIPGERARMPCERVLQALPPGISCAFGTGAPFRGPARRAGCGSSASPGPRWVTTSAYQTEVDAGRSLGPRFRKGRRQAYASVCRAPSLPERARLAVRLAKASGPGGLKTSIWSDIPANPRPSPAACFSLKPSPDGAKMPAKSQAP